MIVKRYVSKGFTLIELIVVIIILGILSVAVAPKFLSFDSDAYKATLKAAEGSMHTSVDMFTAYAQVKGSNGSGTFEGIYIDQFVPWAADARRQVGFMLDMIFLLKFLKRQV